MKSAAVFGANGYIGRHMVRHLVQQGWNVTGYDIHETAAPENEVPYYSINITNKSQVADLNLSVDYIFYFSGLTGTDISFENYEAFINVNELGLLHLLDHIRKGKARPKVIFPSTRLVYKGVPGTPLSEDAEKEFKTIYASSKYNGELYLEMYRNLFNIPYSVFRICVPYGNAFASELSYGTISFFLGRAQNGKPISLFGNGALQRTFTHVLDICKQISEVSILPESIGQCYNIDGETYSLRSIAELLAAKYNVELTYSEWPQNALLLESGDTIFDGSKIRSQLSPTLNYSLEGWIQNM